MSHDEAVSKTFFGDETLQVLGVTSYDDIDVLNGWYQGGAETFVTDFMLAKNGLRRHLIAKACIKFGANAVIEEWLDRRQKLTENGVILPQLETVHSATIVEEYIPYTFSEAYKQAANESLRIGLKVAYAETHKRIIGAGFRPIGMLHDLRSHGDDAVMIDVGSDLGASYPITECSMNVYQDVEKGFRSLISR